MKMEILMVRLNGLADASWNLLQVNAETGRRLALLTCLAFLFCAFVALQNNLMAFADGSFFVFSILMGEAWLLKWSAISARFTVYFLTAAPTEQIVHYFSLGPLQATLINGYFYFLLPFLQFLLASTLVWQKRPGDLVFISLQFALLMALSFGFPSEIFLAPGFLWIGLYAIRTGRSNILVFACFFLLVFCHELALFASAVVVYAFYRERLLHCSVGARLIYLAAIAATYVLFFWLILFGGGTEGSQSNFLYIIDPRLFPVNPMLWLVTAAAILIYGMRSRLTGSVYIRGIFLVIFALLPFILYLILGVNFETGRYPARSITAGLMLVFSLLYVLGGRYRAAEKSHPEVPLFIYSSLGVAITSLVCFALVWSDMNNAVLRMASLASKTQSVGEIDYQIARDAIDERRRAYFDKDTFYWTLPYRALVLSDGRLEGGSIPHYQVLSYEEYTVYQKICRTMMARTNTPPGFSAETYVAFRSYACSRPPGSKPLPVSERARNAMKRYLGYLGL